MQIHIKRFFSSVQCTFSNVLPTEYVFIKDRTHCHVLALAFNTNITFYALNVEAVFPVVSKMVSNIKKN